MTLYLCRPSGQFTTITNSPCLPFPFEKQKVKRSETQIFNTSRHFLIKLKTNYNSDTLSFCVWLCYVVWATAMQLVTYGTVFQGPKPQAEYFECAISSYFMEHELTGSYDQLLTQVWIPIFTKFQSIVLSFSWFHFQINLLKLFISI